MIVAWWWPLPAAAFFAFASGGLAGLRGASIRDSVLAGLFAGPIGVAAAGLSPVVAKTDEERADMRISAVGLFCCAGVAVGILAATATIAT